MALLETHPELEAEQAYVMHAYACMDAMYAGVASLGTHGRNDFEREAFERWKAARMSALSDQTSALVFGRLDQDDAQRFYIGRHHVWGPERETIVVDWRADVARPFYRAGPGEPMGLAQRRRFLVDGREVLGITDDDFAAAIDLQRDEVLQTELRRQVPGRMRDIVATIQGEQDAIIRSPLEGVVVVQGGPGTGKTAIGLHRASFLLYEHREHLSRHKVLVVGPNQTFMRYISQVLPALGEVAVTQRTVGELSPLARVVGTDTPEQARIKGDERMAEVIRRAIDLRCGTVTDDVDLSVRGARVPLTATEVMGEVERIRAMGVPHKRGRSMVRDALIMRAYRTYAERRPPGASQLPFDEVSKQVRADPAFKQILATVWPSVGATALVSDLLTSKPKLAEAAQDILSPDEQALIRRRGTGARTAWTLADRALLDEAHAQIEEPPDRYGHVVVDEAQDLSPMALRAIARRTRDGSMTVLGDLAQATEAWAHRAWDEVLTHLPGEPRLEELTLGYRVAPAIMEAAARVLAACAPDLTAPRSVRADEGEVLTAPVPPDEVIENVPRLARALRERVDFAAIIAPDAMVDDVVAACADAGLDAADTRTEDLGSSISVVPASAAKGLEFDGVLLVEPAAIVAQGRLNLLYICMTRAMRSLVMLHAEELPAPLRQGV